MSIHKLRKEHGSTLVEFVIMLPVLMLLLFGTFELSRLWLTVGVVAEAAREGARTGAVNTPFDATPAVARMNAVLSGASLTAASTPTVTCSSPCNSTSNATVTATVTVNFVTGVPLLVPLFGASKPIQQTAQMRFE